MPFPFLSLPTELRQLIYHFAFIPSTVHLSVLHSHTSLYTFEPSRSSVIRPISQPSDSPDNAGYSAVPISLNAFLISSQLWHEISDLFYAHTTFTFHSVESARLGLQDMSPASRQRVCRISITAVNRNLGDFAIQPGKDVQRILMTIPRLRVLTIRVRLSAFHYPPSSWEHFISNRPSGETDRVAAKWLGQFIRQGLETRLPFQEREVSRYLVDELRGMCGERNLRVERTGWDRYAGGLVEVVVGTRRDSRVKLEMRWPTPVVWGEWGPEII